MTMQDAVAINALRDEPSGLNEGVGMAERMSPPTHRAMLRIVHWTMAALILSMFICGVVMVQLGNGPVSMQLFTLHKTGGTLVLCLVVLRVTVRLWYRITYRWKARFSMHPVHYVLYIVMIAVPLLGWAGVSDFGSRGIIFGYNLPEIWPQGSGYSSVFFTAHAYLAFGFMALILIHIGVALEDYVMRSRGAAHQSEAS